MYSRELLWSRHKKSNGGKQAKENRKQDKNDCKYKVKGFKISVASAQRLFPPFPLLKLGSFSIDNGDGHEQRYFEKEFAFFFSNLVAFISICWKLHEIFNDPLIQNWLN